MFKSFFTPIRLRYLRRGVLAALLLWLVFVFWPVVFHAPLQVGELKIFDRHGTLMAHVAQPDGLLIPLKEDEPLPEQLVSALLRVEDERFLSHWGVNTFSKLRAFRDNLSAQRVVSGGSTLTEQLIKNRYYPESPRTIVQKLREATLAVGLSMMSSKDEVLRSYLDTVYFGHRNYGIKAAMKAYFDKAHLETLTESEIVLLLAILRSPGVLSPSEEFFQERFQRIADRLDWAVEMPDVDLKPFVAMNRFPHVTALIRQRVDSGDLSLRAEIQTTIDADLQETVRGFLHQSLTRLEGNNVSNGAVYVLDPNTGEILVWQGSKDFHAEDIDGQVNLLLQRRQMGSALKPFLYLRAFQQGAHPDELVIDLEKDFQTAKAEEVYRPLNYGLREGGVMPLKTALANSFNVASVRLLEHLGLHETAAFLNQLGLNLNYSADHYGLSLALGTPDLRMKDVADSYALLATGGKQVTPSFIRGESTVSDEPMSGLSEEALYHLWISLSNSLNRRRSFGTNSILNTSIPFAVKTGTTKNFRDNWTFGYHPDLVVATWVGNNDSSSMIDVDGVTGAGPIWHRTVEEAIRLGYVSDRGPEKPDTLSPVQKCLDGDCRQTETIYQSGDRQWLSDLDSGHYCLEDFYQPDVNPAEITKIAKLFNFRDFSITWCEKSVQEEDVDSAETIRILEPEADEIFYLRSDIPAELQQIILKADQEVEWWLGEERVGYGKFIFIQPDEGQHLATAKKGLVQSTRAFEVRWIEGD